MYYGRSKSKYINKNIHNSNKRLSNKKTKRYIRKKLYGKSNRKYTKGRLILKGGSFEGFKHTLWIIISFLLTIVSTISWFCSSIILFVFLIGPKPLSRELLKSRAGKDLNNKNRKQMLRYLFFWIDSLVNTYDCLSGNKIGDGQAIIDTEGKIGFLIKFIDYRAEVIKNITIFTSINDFLENLLLIKNSLLNDNCKDALTNCENDKGCNYLLTYNKNNKESLDLFNDEELNKDNSISLKDAVNVSCYGKKSITVNEQPGGGDGSNSIDSSLGDADGLDEGVVDRHDEGVGDRLDEGVGDRLDEGVGDGLVDNDEPPLVKPIDHYNTCIQSKHLDSIRKILTSSIFIFIKILLSILATTVITISVKILAVISFLYIIFILLDVIKTAINNNRTTPRGIESIILLSGQIISLLGFIASLSVDTPDNLSETPDNLDEIPDETPDKPPADNLDDTSSIIVSKIAASDVAGANVLDSFIGYETDVTGSNVVAATATANNTGVGVSDDDERHSPSNRIHPDMRRVSIGGSNKLSHNEILSDLEIQLYSMMKKFKLPTNKVDICEKIAIMFNSGKQFEENIANPDIKIEIPDKILPQMNLLLQNFIEFIRENPELLNSRNILLGSLIDVMKGEQHGGLGSMRSTRKNRKMAHSRQHPLHSEQKKTNYKNILNTIVIIYFPNKGRKIMNLLDTVINGISNKLSLKQRKLSFRNKPKGGNIQKYTTKRTKRKKK